MMYPSATMKPLTVQEMGRLGGKARAAKLSKKQLSAIGKKAVKAREAKRALANRRPKK